MAIPPRLAAMLNMVQQCNTLADIGTDHAYLPIEACRQNLCQTAIACDINKGPLEIAKANIAAAGYSNSIATRLGNGLEPLNKQEADCIVIAGMGGVRIWQILEAHPQKAQYAKKLILQPQHNTAELRINLHNAGYDITKEVLVNQDSRFYVILQATYTGHAYKWDDKDYFIGKHLQSSPLFLEYTKQQKEKIAGYVNAIKNDNDLKIAKQRLQWLEDILC